MPIGIYDAAKLDGDIEIALGKDETGYEGLNGRFNSLKNILYSKDEQSPFGIRLLIRHVLRLRSKRLKHYIFYLRPSLSEERAATVKRSR